jgi:hypothetical protein
MKEITEKVIETSFRWSINEIKSICKDFNSLDQLAFFDFIESKILQIIGQFPIQKPKVVAKKHGDKLCVSFEFTEEKLFHYENLSEFPFVKWSES